MVPDTIKTLRNNRTPGEDAIRTELIKYGGNKLWKRVYDLIMEIWNAEIMPRGWNTAVICPIYKKGNKLNCTNYRGIFLLNVTYKIFTNILAEYIRPYTEQTLGEYQSGFRRGRSTTDHIFSLRTIYEKFAEYNIAVSDLR